jgi:hypothetical protein
MKRWAFATVNFVQTHSGVDYSSMSLEYAIYLLIYRLLRYVITSSYGHTPSLVWKTGECWNGRILALSQISWKRLRMTRKTAFQTDGVPIKIWNEYLQNNVYTRQPARAPVTVGYNWSCANTHTVLNTTYVPQGLRSFSINANRRSNDDLYRIYKSNNT